MLAAALRHPGGMLDMVELHGPAALSRSGLCAKSGSQVPQRSKKTVKQYPHSMA
jgi:hypothetical protein